MTCGSSSSTKVSRLMILWEPAGYYRRGENSIRPPTLKPPRHVVYYRVYCWGKERPEGRRTAPLFSGKEDASSLARSRVPGEFDIGMGPLGSWFPGHGKSAYENLRASPPGKGTQWSSSTSARGRSTGGSTRNQKSSGHWRGERRRVRRCAWSLISFC